MLSGFPHQQDTLHAGQDVTTPRGSDRAHVYCRIYELRQKHIHSVSVRKHKGKRSLGRPKHRWDDNIKMDFIGIGWEFVDSIHLAQERENLGAVVKMVMNVWVLLNAQNFLPL
jgi:hypothetical protein